MTVSATAASSMARSEPAHTADTVRKLSFPYASLLLSALFNFIFLLFTICTATSLCILIQRYSSHPQDVFPDRFLLAAIVCSLAVDLLYFSLRLHNRAQTPNSSTTYAAYFREKPASLLRLWGRSSHHRRLYFRWQGHALRWMVPMDVLAVCVCVLPVHVTAAQMANYTGWDVPKLLIVYHTILTSMSWSLEAVVLLELLLSVVRRCVEPEQPNVLMWHPETGSLTPVHPHAYGEAMARQQSSSTLPFVAAHDQPEWGPPAYGEQDIEDSYTAQQQQHNPTYIHQQSYGPHRAYSPQKQHAQHARHHSDHQLEGAQRAEGQPQEGKAEHERGHRRQRSAVHPAAAAAVDVNEGVEGQGEGGELGAATAPLVMMMSPAVMDEDNGAASLAATAPRVMLHVRPSDADATEQRNPRAAAMASPRYAVVHMSSQ